MDKFCGIEFWHLRITTHQSIETIKLLIECVSVKYIISSEDGHYHCLFQTAKKRKELREEINKHGFKGNKDFSLTTVRDVKKARSYVVKDGSYIFKGYTQKEIEDAYKLSFKKKGYSEDLLELEEKYLTKGMMFERFVEAVVSLKVQYNHNLNKTHIKSYLEKMRCKQDPQYLRSFCQELFSNGYY